MPVPVAVGMKVGEAYALAMVGEGDGEVDGGGFEMWTSPRAAGVTPSQCCTNVASNART
jgi:hypothetical protein